MQEKKNLLIVGDFNRKDFLEPFYACKQDFNFFFIEFASREEIISCYFQEYGKAIFWKDFSDAYDLLQKIDPFKVVFYFLESFNHIALNVACKKLGIKTYHLEHGFLDLDLQQKMEATRLPVQGSNHYKKPARSLISRLSYIKTKIQNRLFFYNTVRKSSGPANVFLKNYYHIRKKHTISQTFIRVNSPFRLADEYISFSPANFKQLIKRDHLKTKYPVHFIGVPNFDRWANIKPALKLKNYMIFIPQPLVEQGWLGWTEEFERQFLQELAGVCKRKNYKIFVKLHPYQNPAIWQDFSARQDLKLISDNELKELIPETKVIAGFFSTLLLPLTIINHTVVVSFENHPVKSINPSGFLTKAGVSYAINVVKELEEILDFTDHYQAFQANNKASFAKTWLGYSDGRAGERLKAILLKP